jgi:hypothetical protein
MPRLPRSALGYLLGVIFFRLRRKGTPKILSHFGVVLLLIWLFFLCQLFDHHQGLDAKRGGIALSCVDLRIDESTRMGAFRKDLDYGVHAHSRSPVFFEEVG